MRGISLNSSQWKYCPSLFSITSGQVKNIYNLFFILFYMSIYACVIAEAREQCRCYHQEYHPPLLRQHLPMASSLPIGLGWLISKLWGSSHFLCYHAGNFSMSSRDPTQALMFAKQPLDQLSWFFPALVASSLCLCRSLATVTSLPLSIGIVLKPSKPITAVGSGAIWGLTSPSCVGLVTFASHLRLLP